MMGMATNSEGIHICDFCPSPAKYDSPTQFGGQWAHTCEPCFWLYCQPLTPESKIVTILR